MLITMFCTALAIALLLPETLAGKLMRRLLVELPARKLAQLTPARVASGLLVIMGIAGVIAFAKMDGLLVTAAAIPEGIAWFAAFDVATYIDVIGVVVLVAATVRFRAAYRAACSAAARVRKWTIHCVGAFQGRQQRGARDRPRRSRRRVPPPPTGDDGDWALAFAGPENFRARPYRWSIDLGGLGPFSTISDLPNVCYRRGRPMSACRRDANDRLRPIAVRAS